MRNFFCYTGLAGIVLLLAGYYFIDDSRFFYFAGITLVVAGFIGISRT